MRDGNIVINKDGKDVKCDILFSFVCNENGKGYVGYTDHSMDENNKERVYVNCYDPSKGINNLEKIETQAEWDMVNTLIERIKNL